MKPEKSALCPAPPLPLAVRGVLAFVVLFLPLVLSTTSPPAFAAAAYRSLHNRETGIRFDYPATWKYGLERDGSLVIRGRRGTPPQYAFMVVQTLSGTTDAAGSLDAVLRKSTRLKGFRLILRGEEKLDAGRAPYFVIRYETPLHGQPVVWKHIHLAVSDGRSVHLLSYRAPESIFGIYKKHFDHLVLSLSFTGAGSPATTPQPRRPVSARPPTRFVLDEGWLSDYVGGYRFRLPPAWRYEVKKNVIYAFSPSGRAGFFALGDVVDGHVDAGAWADAAEKALSGRLGFMEKRLLRSNFKYLGYVPEGMEYIVRDYEGHIGRTPVRGHVLYATYGLRVYVAGIFLSRRNRRGVREIEDVLNDFETTIGSLEEASTPPASATAPATKGTPRGGSVSIGAPPPAR